MSPKVAGRLWIVLAIPALFLLIGCTSSGGRAGSAGEVMALSATSTGTNGDLRTVSDLPPPSDTAGGMEQPIAPRDVIEVAVFQVPDLSRTVQVDDGGRLNLPLIGTIQAAGKSVRTLESEIAAAYGKSYLQSPQISVLVKESQANRVTIDGEVRRAGVFPLPPSSTLLDAIALAGGFNDIADPSKVFVFRQVGGQKLVANYDVAQIRKGQRSAPRLFGGDVVVVFPSGGRIALQNLKEVLGVATSASRIATVP